MNDYNGTVVSKSRPVKSLKTVKKTFFVDSADRDTVKYPKNGDFVVYLPRVYENIVSIRLKSAEFPPTLSVSNSVGLVSHSYTNGTTYTSDAAVTGNLYYFFLELEGLNKGDELAVGANKSTLIDNAFAKIPVSLTTFDSTPKYCIQYNDNSQHENIAEYSPPIGKLDRLHIRVRTHAQQDNSGFVYWTDTGAHGGTVVNFGLTFEIEYMDNAFDSFSSFETHLANRS